MNTIKWFINGIRITDTNVLDNLMLLVEEPIPAIGTIVNLEYNSTHYSYLVCGPESESIQPLSQPLTSRQLIEKYRNASESERLSMVRLGFELETQQTEGLTWATCESGEPDMDRMHEYATERAQEYATDIDEFFTYIEDEFIQSLNMLASRKKRELLAAVNINTLHEACKSGLLTIDESDVIESMESTILDNVNSDDFCESGDIGQHIDIPARIEAVNDSSVSGFEFRTIGGLELAEVKTAAENIFRFDHKIDTKCSFHVHISIPGVKHQYGTELQAAMTEYLLINIAKIPDSIKQRWADDCGYFKPMISRDKYAFVHMHDQGTWEFRCFGNVKNSKDAETCFLLATEALQYGYKVVAGNITLLKQISGVDNSRFRELCEDSMHQTIPLDLVVANYLDQHDESIAA